MYSDADAALLYDVLNQWGPEDDFYLSLMMSAESVLDVGCGTGRLLHGARSNAHGGRLTGIDPDPDALDIARTRTDVEWELGTAASLRYDGEFELAVMTGHAFQCLVTDDDLYDSLAAIARSLTPGGRFAFETRNPRAMAWKHWAAMDPMQVVDPSGRTVRVSYDVLAVEGDLVTFEEITSDADDHRLRADRATLRFLDLPTLERFLAEADLVLERAYGDWDRSPVQPASEELIIVAQRVGAATSPT